MDGIWFWLMFKYKEVNQKQTEKVVNSLKQTLIELIIETRFD